MLLHDLRMTLTIADTVEIADFVCVCGVCVCVCVCGVCVCVHGYVYYVVFVHID